MCRRRFRLWIKVLLAPRANYGANGGKTQDTPTGRGLDFLLTGMAVSSRLQTWVPERAL